MSVLSSLRESVAPRVAVEIAAGHVSAATLEWRGGQAFVAGHATEPLPVAALVPSLTTANTHDRAAVQIALNRVLDRICRHRLTASPHVHDGGRDLVGREVDSGRWGRRVAQ